MNRIVLLAAIFIAGMSVGRANAADLADEYSQSTPPVCAKTEAVWTPISNDNNDDVSVRSQGPTRKWSCMVGSNELVVKYQYGHPTHQCSATVSITVSAWINGVKIVDRAGAGDDGECLSNPSSTLAKIALRADGSAQVCHTEADVLEETSKHNCDRMSAGKIRTRKRDPAFVPLGQTSKPGFDLHVSNAAFCPTLTAELKPVDWESDDDPAFARYLIAGTENWHKTTFENVMVSNGKTGAEYSWSLQPRTARFDADNDGPEDKVELDAVLKYHGYVMGELRWTHTSPDTKPFTAGELPWGEPWEQVKSPGFVLYNESASVIKGQNSYVASAIQPVRLFGRNYLYLRRHSADREGQEWNVGEDYYATSDFGPRIITRGIAELYPDGKTTLVCGWGPRPRPEDFL